jgi:DNA-binding transcriptional regulator GbsR (MarR family)
MKTAKPHLTKTIEAVEDQFVELWGAMSSLWGISPTMARIHGLLYMSSSALSMDDIMARLAISRGNVSMNLSKLVEWGLVRRVHKKGDRRDYYESLADVWEIFTRVAAQRKRLEIDPILATLRQCRRELSPERLGTLAHSPEAQARYHRVDDLLQFLTLMERLAEKFFTSQGGLREAVELLAHDEQE